MKVNAIDASKRDSPQIRTQIERTLLLLQDCIPIVHGSSLRCCRERRRSLSKYFNQDTESRAVVLSKATDAENKLRREKKRGSPIESPCFESIEVIAPIGLLVTYLVNEVISTR